MGSIVVRAIARFMGIFIAFMLLVAWLGSFIWGYIQDLALLPPWLIIAMVAIRTFLQTGLFITAHDAMHRAVSPSHQWVNDWMGAIALTAYAGLPYDDLCRKHFLHHQAPTSTQDPDFCREYQNNPGLWYLTFMRGYLWPCQGSTPLLRIIYAFILFWQGFHLPIANLLLYWLLPIGLSSVQLFYFGTFLPHRQDLGLPPNRHYAQSSSYPALWSLLTCYHFGYHWEHHEYPHLPWYQLPIAKWS